LQEEGIELHFAAAGLDLNPYFLRGQFAFTQVTEARRTVWSIAKGFVRSVQLLLEKKPDFVVGFGSFHSLPVLMAAFLLRIPFGLFESNAHAGRVNRFFSYFAEWTAVQFADAAIALHGQTPVVSLPLWEPGDLQFKSKKEALAYFGLQGERKTVLVFGGSQGALFINQLMLGALTTSPIQIIHFIGSKQDPIPFIAHYKALGTPACVKPFETQMRAAWLAADCAICRAGAVTLMESIAFEVPTILIPFPKAAEDHQTKNALFMEKIGASVHLSQSLVTAACLQEKIKEFLQEEKLSARKEAIRVFKNERKKVPLSLLIKKIQCNRPTILSESAE